jgi:predicted amidohydrolase
LKLAAVSLTSTSDKQANLRQAVQAVRDAKSLGADWIQLPEMLAFHGDYGQVFDMAESEGGPTHQLFANLAKELKVVLFAGTVGERPGPELDEKERLNRHGQKRVYNTLYVFDRSGTQIAKYRKTHLFNLLHEDGTPHYCESDGFIPGEEPASCEIDGLHVGLSICYDLRFPGLYTRLAKDRPLDIIAVPSAFTKKTGEAHWAALLRARAIENQAYVFAANQVGVHGPGKESWGHSLIFDAWGQQLSDSGAEPGIAVGEFSNEKLAAIRHKLPALSNRLPFLY